MSAFDWSNPALTRRQLLKALSAVTGAGAASAAGGVTRRAWPRTATPQTVARAASTAAAGSDLGALEHIVFLMMENRSYDHYFGSYKRGRGFDDHPAGSLGPFAQTYPGAGALSPRDVLLPFRLNAGVEECTNDLTHEWGPMHLCWNHGRMDSFVRVHTEKGYEGVPNGAMTMGYYTRAELPFYYAVADQFTLCDNYHCSILGPTHPNRLMANSGTIDPGGLHGGPVTDTNPDPSVLWTCNWPTMHEVLEDAGVSWKVYHPSSSDLPPQYLGLATYPTFVSEIYDPTLNPAVMFLSDHVLPYFSAFENPASSLHQKAFGPTFPGQFAKDVASGSLPSVSWIIPPLGFDEHPSSAPDRGMWFTSLVLDTLLSNPDVWSKTALFVMYDENDGWFDHVPPPTPPAGTPGEELTTSKAISSETLGIRRPLGLGVRVPMLVISPFSRGGHIASEVFDHTSQLKLVHERFGVEIPNHTAWRSGVVGDLTSTLFQHPTNASAPTLPTMPVPPIPLTGSCNEFGQDSELGGASPSIPTHQSMPSQERDPG